MPLDEPTLALLTTLSELVDPPNAPPSTPAQIEAAEATLGRRFPEELRWWLGHVGPTSAMEHNVRLITALEPADDSSRFATLTTAANELRAVDQTIPDELIVFGFNGGGEVLGVWVPREGDAVPAVIQIGEGHSDEDPCIWVIGESFSAALRGLFMIYESDDQEYIGEALGIPESLWVVDEEADEDDLDADDLDDDVFDAEQAAQDAIDEANDNAGIVVEPDPDAVHEDMDEHSAPVRALLRFTSPSLGDLVTEPWGRLIDTDEIRAALRR